MSKNCAICGEYSGYYPLCRDCADKYREGLIDKDEYGNWFEVDDEKEYNQIEYENENEECIVCGENAPYGKQCKECYYETLEYQDEIDKNRKAYELREWYYNLKDKIYRMSDYEEIQTNCNKLIAIALLLRNLHNDTSTINRVYNDISDILTKKQKQTIQQKEQETIIDYDKNYIAGQSRALDGHWLDNDFERDIDDMLYNLRIVHVYAKKVNEITERTVKCDWFIPVISNSKGIYIEFWGKSSPDYIRNKQEKIKLYKDYDLELIEINKDEMIDKQLVQDRLETEINKIKKEMTKKYR